MSDEIYQFAKARLREGLLPDHQALALNALLEETIWPFAGADSIAGRNADRALRLFAAQWSTHTDYREEWRP